MHHKEKIGIGYLTYKRQEVIAESVRRTSLVMPKNARMVVVDDFRFAPSPVSTHIQEKRMGVAAGKNRCIELLEDCDYLFLLDDDCYALREDSFQKYIDAHKKTGCHHFSLTWKDNSKTGGIVSQNENMVEYSHAAGVMLFMTKKCIQAIGGMDPKFGIYGSEHRSYSTRAHNAGLTPHRYCDIPNSLELFYPIDYHGGTIETMPRKTKHMWIKSHSKLRWESMTSSEFIPYK